MSLLEKMGISVMFYSVGALIVLSWAEFYGKDVPKACYAVHGVIATLSFLFTLDKSGHGPSGTGPD